MSIILAGVSLGSAPAGALGMRGAMLAVDTRGPGYGSQTGPVCDPIESDCWGAVGVPTVTYILNCNYPCVGLWGVTPNTGADVEITNLDTGETCKSNFGQGICQLPRGWFEFKLTAHAWGPAGGASWIVFH